MTLWDLSMSLCLTSLGNRVYIYSIYITKTNHNKCKAKIDSKANSVLATNALTTPNFKPQQKRQNQCFHHSTLISGTEPKKTQNNQKKVDLWGGVASRYIKLFCPHQQKVQNNSKLIQYHLAHVLHYVLGTIINLQAFGIPPCGIKDFADEMPKGEGLQSHDQLPLILQHFLELPHDGIALVDWCRLVDVKSWWLALNHLFVPSDGYRSHSPIPRFVCDLPAVPKKFSKAKGRKSLQHARANLHTRVNSGCRGDDQWWPMAKHIISYVKNLQTDAGKDHTRTHIILTAYIWCVHMVKIGWRFIGTSIGTLLTTVPKVNGSYCHHFGPWVSLTPSPFFFNSHSLRWYRLPSHRSLSHTKWWWFRGQNWANSGAPHEDGINGQRNSRSWMLLQQVIAHTTHLKLFGLDCNPCNFLLVPCKLSSESRRWWGNHPLWGSECPAPRGSLAHHQWSSLKKKNQTEIILRTL